MLIPTYNQRQQEIRKILKANPNIAIEQLAKRMGLRKEQVLSAISPMTDIGEDNNRLILVDWSKLK